MRAYPIRLTRAWFPGYGYRWYYRNYRYVRHYVRRARPHMTPCDNAETAAKDITASAGAPSKK